MDVARVDSCLVCRGGLLLTVGRQCDKHGSRSSILLLLLHFDLACIVDVVVIDGFF